MQARRRRLTSSAWASVRVFLSDGIGRTGGCRRCGTRGRLTRPTEWRTAVDVIRGIALRVLAVGAVVYVWAFAREGWGEYWLHPELGWAEDRWWFDVTVRDVESYGFSLTVTDDHAHSVSRFLGQAGVSERVWFPGAFATAGNKAGTDQPWGRYTVRWDVWRDRWPYHISARARFAWQANPGLTKKHIRQERRERKARRRNGVN